MNRAYIEGAAETVQRHSVQVQEKTRTEPGGKAVKARGELVVGHAAEEILRYADENNIDLILMATHGRSGVKRWALGSVADKVLRASKVAELVDVVLLRVCELPEILADYPEAIMELSWEEHVEKEKAWHRQAGERYLAGVEKRLSDAGLRVRSEVLLGRPIDEIIDYANKNPFHLIVLATHGRTGATRWAYGQVADRVLQRGNGPIFLVRPQ
jgi:nucleotide-binding universal stress UspA family protein